VEKIVTEPAELFSLRDQVALVAGGYGGIGQAVCRTFAGFGARVAVAGSKEASAKSLAAAIDPSGERTLGIGFDARDVGSVQQMTEAVAGRWGRLDVLVNCVGGNIREERASEVTEAGWNDVVLLNLTSAMFLAQAAAKHMVAGGRGGRQVHIGSVRSLLALRNRGFAAYCASKGGLAILCKQLAAEWAPERITVNMVSPTFVRTPQGERFLQDPAFLQSVLARIPLGRIGETSDVVAAVTFLASPAASFVTGQTLYLDGGLTATQ
jgi:NAD(P)-dependent dehydrogenase (short-subunit alcohol dehydrogenase family)